MKFSKVLQAVLAGVAAVVGGRLLEWAELRGADVAAFTCGVLLVAFIYVSVALRTLFKRLEALEGGTTSDARQRRRASAA